MRKPKLKRYPKKPKASAPIATQEAYIHKVKAIDDYNFSKVNEYKQSKRLHGIIQGIKPKHHNWEPIKTYKRSPSVKSHKRRVSGAKKRGKKRRR